MKTVKPWFVVAVSILTTLFYHALAPRSVEAHTYSGAPTFTTFAPNQPLPAATLNATLAHLHATFSANIDDTMINAAASIQHSKMQYPALIPKAWAMVPFCNAGTCTITESSRISSVVWNATGDYIVTLNYTATNSNYLVMAASNTDNAGTPNITECYATTRTTASFHLKCSSALAFAAANSTVNFVMFDSDNP